MYDEQILKKNISTGGCIWIVRKDKSKSKFTTSNVVYVAVVYIL